MAASRVVWTDKSTSLLLEALQSRESLWNTKSEAYRNRNVKKTEYGELQELLRDEIPYLDLPALKAKIQSLRTSFREEVRKIKKSEGTGSGSSDVYIPKWKFFSECSFLEDVIISSRPSFSNTTETTPPALEDEIEISETDSTPKKKQRKASWMETAATALTELAKEAGNTNVEDEWEVFGKDVANSIRSLSNIDLQFRVKFAIQSAIFQAHEDSRAPQPPAVPYNSFPVPYQDDTLTCNYRY